MPHLLGKLKYQKIKGIGKASLPNPDAEPNFYLLPALPEKHVVEAQQKKSTMFPCATSVVTSDALIVSDDEDDITFEEYVAINRLMRFPGPFTPPSVIQA